MSQKLLEFLDGMYWSTARFLCKRLNVSSTSTISTFRNKDSVLNSLQDQLLNVLTIVWRHVAMVAKFLDHNNLTWQRRPFALSNDGRKVWTTVFFFSWALNHAQESHKQWRIKGDQSSRPWDKGRPGLQKNIFRPFGPLFGLKIRGTRAPRAPFLDPPLIHVNFSFFPTIFAIPPAGCWDPEILLQPWQRDVTTSFY